ncbi:hypothetical protein [Flavobacterium silvaticum]|uniref:DUF4468 domain-containing protein n=1 Tax=Flavobacterium silvaticum TaxID=1852020 RepID=A0A972FL53_9FLAO|nr:hypothetical protein [Flavobacterium silvaticum]NMH27677.1 hypothetical protein [Flavobacterium silvaticum]
MKKAVFAAVLFVSALASAQDIDVKKGDFGFLAGQKEINVEFTYDKLKLMEDNLSDEKYVADRVADLNSKEKGKGDIWKKKWYSSREDAFEPKFISLVNTMLEKKGQSVNFGKGLGSAKYTLIVEAVWIYPGYNVGIMKKGAKVSTNLKFVETANKGNVLLEISMEKAPGDIFGGSFSNEDRIAEGYAKTGKSLGQYLLKKAYK